MPEPQKDKLTAKQKRMWSDYHHRQHVAAQPVKPPISAIDSVESIYKALNDQNEIKGKALLILMLRSWLTEVSSFDPVSGHTLHTSIVDFMGAVAKSVQDESPESEIKDRIYRIVSHTKEAVLAIMEHPRDKILREHAMLPIHAAREVDSKSVQWLSLQPGRTLREKLSGKPYIKAVKRRCSVDTAENRLLRAFLFRIEQILIERQNALFAATEETCEEMLVSLQRWLRTEDAAEIGVWGNLPPNNTLLQDKRYRKVWDGWLWLQAIDEQITGDSKRVHQDSLSVIYWNTLSLLNRSGRFRTVQQPVGLDYDNFAISPELPVRGYLFPERDSRGRGFIENLENDFGFLSAENGGKLYFHKNNLSNGLNFRSLKSGDTVSFVVGCNHRGDCAKDVRLISSPESLPDPQPVSICLHPDRFHIHLDNKDLIVGFYDGELFLLMKPEGTKKKLDFNGSIFKEIPKTILSLVTDSPFEYSEPTNNQCVPIRLDSSVVDLFSIRPMFTNHTGSKAHLPFRLLQQYWPLKLNGRLVIDCGYAKSIVLRPDIETVSMRSLFSRSSTLSNAIKSNASMFFTKKLSDYITADKLTYLVPDWGNDFDLEGIRKIVNFYFDESTPLPKSIAAIFAWQSSKKFVQDKVRENDFVLVVDSFDDGISITPVQAIYQKELAAILPETQGISWERHPTVIVENRSIHTSIVRNLTKDGCQVSEELIQLFGLDGLTSDAGEVSFVNDDNWYHLPGSIREALNQDLDVNILSNNIIGDCLNSINRDCRGANVFILPLEDTIKKPEYLKDNYCWIYEELLPVEGGVTLDKWQNKVDDITLWRDHLPELSVRIVCDGHFENFYLVKDATVAPQRGRTVNIPVEKSFTLPAGQTHYSFPLQQGEGNKELQFVAYLKSPAFPLKKATDCKLKMTYTYGADNPYELKFIPLNLAEAGFKSIRVEWRFASEVEAADLENLPVPEFPARKSWSDFQKFPKEDGKSFSDLLDWVKRDMKKISDIAHYGRVSGTIPKWIDKGNSNVFCFLDNVFIHKSSLSLSSEQELPQPGDILSFYKIEGDSGKFSAEDVVIGSSQPTRCFLYSSLRFPTLTIWNHGHSLSEPDVPGHFRNAIFGGIQKCLSIIESENMPKSLEEELFFFLCCLHKDAPGIVGTRLLVDVKDKKLLLKYHKNIAFAIGNAELLYQQELLDNVIEPIDKEGLTISITMEILSIALWRSKSLINRLTKEELGALTQKLYGCLEFDVQKVVRDVKSNQIATLCKHLELLLALLRSRGNEDKNFKIILAPDKELTRKYVKLVDDISRIVIDSDIEIKSRISLQIEKPEMFRKTPDLLYALRMYLTGDSGANTIIITGISDENQGL
jgi:cold shock CspA family protein